MEQIVLIEVPVNLITLYDDLASNAFQEAQEQAKNSPTVKWALANNCRVKITTITDYYTGDSKVIFYTALTPIQQTEFALRF